MQVCLLNQEAADIFWSSNQSSEPAHFFVHNVAKREWWIHWKVRDQDHGAVVAILAKCVEEDSRTPGICSLFAASVWSVRRNKDSVKSRNKETTRNHFVLVNTRKTTFNAKNNFVFPCNRNKTRLGLGLELTSKIDQICLTWSLMGPHVSVPLRGQPNKPDRLAENEFPSRNTYFETSWLNELVSIHSNSGSKASSTRILPSFKLWAAQKWKLRCGFSVRRAAGVTSRPHHPETKAIKPSSRQNGQHHTFCRLSGLKNWVPGRKERTEENRKPPNNPILRSLDDRKCAESSKTKAGVTGTKFLLDLQHCGHWKAFATCSSVLRYISSPRLKRKTCVSGDKSFRCEIRHQVFSNLFCKVVVCDRM